MSYDPKEAPAGYYAVLKADVPQDQGNLCRFCDWRKTCQDHETDFLAWGHRCSAYAVIAIRDGLTYQRDDQCSVLFKRLPDSARYKQGELL